MWYYKAWRLWLDPGIIFSKETALFERVNIACPRAILEKALEQLYEAMTENR
jgi:cystathionine beta-lyase